MLAALVVHRPGPNSPLAWVERCVAELLSVRDARTRELVARKLLVGVPFYGYDMLPGDFKPILISRFVFSFVDAAAADRLTFTYNDRSAIRWVCLRLISDVHRFLEILKEHRPAVRWNAKASEHSVEYATGGGQHLATYPTLPMLRARLDLALGSCALPLLLCFHMHEYVLSIAVQYMNAYSYPV